MNIVETEKQLAAREAVGYLKNSMIVGLGTGSTAHYAIKEIGYLVQQGLDIKAVATSESTAALAGTLNIPLLDINTVNSIDITIDGADEFTPDLFLMKGGGGALFREKIVATITKEQIIIADSTKLVSKLGKFKLPVEVIPFALNYVITQISQLKAIPLLRMVKAAPFITDQGNYIIDIDFGLIDEPPLLAAKLDLIEGVVAHGLFINLANKIIMGKGNELVLFP
ncbi:MAG: ribose-5-phosphate isomerase RpiA [Rhizobacter sp.]|nr:ribose-5-phosphate isomerase RpiA [Ferruginibacter sp.]